MPLLSCLLTGNSHLPSPIPTSRILGGNHLCLCLCSSKKCDLSQYICMSMYPFLYICIHLCIYPFNKPSTHQIKHPSNSFSLMSIYASMHHLPIQQVICLGSPNKTSSQQIPIQPNAHSWPPASIYILIYSSIYLANQLSI